MPESTVFDAVIVGGSYAGLASPLGEQLGCEVEVGPNGPYMLTNESRETTVPGVYGCGDASRMMHSVTFAVSDGAMAGMSAHRTLIFA